MSLAHCKAVGFFLTDAAPGAASVALVAAAFSIIFGGRGLRLWSQRRRQRVVIIWPLTRGELVNMGENV